MAPTRDKKETKELKDKLATLPPDLLLMTNTPPPQGATTTMGVDSRKCRHQILAVGVRALAANPITRTAVPSSPLPLVPTRSTTDSIALAIAVQHLQLQMLRGGHLAS